MSQTQVPRLQELAPLPQGRAGMAAAVYEDQIYLFSGDTVDGITGNSLRYDIKLNEWHAISDKPTPVRDIQAVLIDEKIYVPGGLGSSGVTSQLEVYDPRSDNWEEKTAIPQSCTGYALATLYGKLFLFGGSNGKDYLDEVYIYDPTMDTWQQGTDMPTARAFAEAGVAGGKISIIGGINANGSLALSESYTPNRDRLGEQPWITQPALPKGEDVYGMQSIGDVLFVVGRNTTGQYSILQFLPQTDQWTYFDVLSPALFGQHLAITSHQGYLYLLGGTDDSGKLSEKAFRYQVIYTLYIPVLNK